MDILEFLIQIALFFVAFKLGQWSILVPMKLALAKLAKEKGIDLEKLLEELRSEQEDVEPESTKQEEFLNIERVDGIYFAYGDQGRFLAQGTDFRSMFENVKQRFPGQNFRINNYNANLTEEEAGRLVKAVFETFGGNNDAGRTR